ncbi:JBTS17 [Mytilus coruscus]|uniref:JBTS17 n=1 Tax=Mytilus coruscus TaxID=42192 RepID=A0A6J8AFE3_MYTCO|nr:JBTS17 [Mytilus coruscus]
MKLELEVLASTNIKRKKPWPKIVWVGEEKESLLLLDNKSHRLSVLYVPSGNTKRRINKLSPLLEHAEIITTTKNGRYVVGFLKSGEVFIWHKDQDILKSIHGLETIVSEEDFIHGKTAIFSSNDCKHIIVILGTSHIYIWNREQTESVLESKVPEIRGTWNLITVPTEAGIPNCDECPECSVEGIFFTHQTNFLKSDFFDFIRTKDFNVDGKRSLPPVNVEWTVIHYPLKLIHPSCKPVYRHGAFITKYADNGQVIAVAANQENPMHTGVLFASPLCDTVLPVSLNGCGSRDPYSQTGRNFWVSDMEWTCDSLFLACSLRNGCVCLLTRLGEPLVIQISWKVSRYGTITLFTIASTSYGQGRRRPNSFQS